MIQFSAILVLYIYLGMMAVLLIVSLGHIFHALRFGGLNPLSIFTSGLFIAGLVVILWVSNSLLLHIDWGGVFQINLPSAQFLHLG